MVHDLDTLKRLNAEATQNQRPILQPQELADIIERRLKFADTLDDYERGYNAAVVAVAGILRELSR